MRSVSGGAATFSHNISQRVVPMIFFVRKECLHVFRKKPAFVSHVNLFPSLVISFHLSPIFFFSFLVITIYLYLQIPLQGLDMEIIPNNLIKHIYVSLLFSLPSS